MHDAELIIAYLFIGACFGTIGVYGIAFLQGKGLLIDFYKKQYEAETIFGTPYSTFGCTMVGWVVMLPLLALFGLLFIVAPLGKAMVDSIQQTAKNAAEKSID